MTHVPTGTTSEQPAAIFFDGRVSRKRIVQLIFADQLAIVEDGKTLTRWAYPGIHQADASGDILRIVSGQADDLARLDIFDARLKQEIVTRCNLLAHPPNPPSFFRVSTIAAALGAIASIGVSLWLGIPYAADHLAPLVPWSWEMRLGQATEGQVRRVFPSNTCTNPAGVAALTVMTDHLKEAAALPISVSIEVLSSSVPNAFALPGGKVFLLKGLLDKANSPDEVAGVLAHELGHVRHRDHLRRLIANGGTAYIVGLLFGDVSGAGALLFATKALLGAAYSRDAESAADSFSADIMSKLGRSTKPMGELLVRISGPAADSRFDLLHDHPLSDARLAELTRRDKGNTGPPLLDDAQWTALKAICK